MLDQIPAEERIGSVTSDDACCTRKCHAPIADRDAHGVTPPGSHTEPWNAVDAGAAAGNATLREAKYFGPTISRHQSGHHRQSRIETRMPCAKLPEQWLMAPDFDR